MSASILLIDDPARPRRPSRGPQRLRPWAAALSRSTPPAALYELRALHAWAALGALVADDLSEMVGQPIETSPGWQCGAGAPLVATIPLLAVDPDVELRISLLADPAPLRWLAETMLGPCDACEDSVLVDLLCEMANLASGAVKRVIVSEGTALTTGVPENQRAARANAPSDGWTLSIGPAGGPAGARVGLVAEVSRRHRALVEVRSMREGMVLAQDVREPGGRVAVPRGTWVTTTTAATLSQILGAETLVEISDAA